MDTSMRWTSSDLLALPDDNGLRYEIIDGELYVSSAPHSFHERLRLKIAVELENWSRNIGRGEANLGCGLIFSEDNDVIPDAIWISEERLKAALEEDGKLHLAPELVVEVLSPGRANERRDREAKLGLYSRRGVEEYWIIDWRKRCIDVYRQVSGALAFIATLDETDTLSTPLLPGFSCPLAPIFERIPR